MIFSVHKLRCYALRSRTPGGGEATLRRFSSMPPKASKASMTDLRARRTWKPSEPPSIAGRLSSRPLPEIARGVAEAPTHTSGSPLIDRLLDGVAKRFTEGYTEAVAPLREALEMFRHHAQEGGVGSTRWFPLAWLLAAELWDDELVEALAARAVQLARDAGTLADLPLALDVSSARAHQRG